jgi:hypothetical protein
MGSRVAKSTPANYYMRNIIEKQATATPQAIKPLRSLPVGRKQIPVTVLPQWELDSTGQVAVMSVPGCGLAVLAIGALAERLGIPAGQVMREALSGGNQTNY